MSGGVDAFWSLKAYREAIYAVVTVVGLVNCVELGASNGDGVLSY